MRRRQIQISLLVLILFSLPAMARTSQLTGSAGDSGDCVEATAAVDATDATDAKATAKRVVGRPATKVRPTTPSHADGSPARTTPRWHRFLPGMFR